MSYLYFIRINKLDGYDVLVKEVFSGQKFMRVLLVQHTGRAGNNHHYHATISTDYKIPALRLMLKGVFKLGKGNGHISIKPWDGSENPNQYLFHEGYDTPILVQKIYTDKDIERFKKNCAIIKEKIIANTPTQMCQAILVDVIRLNNPSKKNICMLIWDYYQKQGDWFPNKFQLERYVMRIQASFAEHQDGGNSNYNWNQQKLNWFEEMFPEKKSW